MKKHASESARGKDNRAVCSHCGGTGRDSSKSLWGEFICLACGGTGKPVRNKCKDLTVDQAR